MKIEARLIKENEYITTEWSGGKTTELFIYPENTRYKDFNFKFRISSATVELEKSEFTKLPHIYRFITPLDNDLKLTHDHIDYINLKPYEIYEFQGDNHTSSFGKARDFNLMLRDGAKGQLQSICINREHSLTEEEFNYIKEAFSSVGEIEVVPNHLMGVGGALSGCAPAYIYMVIEALADGAVMQGMPRKMAYKLASHGTRIR